MDSNLPVERIAALTAWFQHIYETRMVDVPICNRALAIEASGFRRYEDGWLGVLVTPWFINIVALPVEGEGWAVLSAGTFVMRDLPAGARRFAVEREGGIGTFQMTNLYSPPHYPNQECARAAGLEALEAALRAPEPAPAPPPPAAEAVAVGRRALFHGLVGEG